MKLCHFNVGIKYPLFLIAGPCVIESEGMVIEVAGKLKEMTDKLGIPYIFKSSFDKANRSSNKTFKTSSMEIKEGEVITHSMVTKSVQRAQQKLETRNFSIRKHVLEYDMVMNRQREIIYGRRNYFLDGVERLMRDAKITQIYEGTSEIQELVVSREILKGNL